MATNVQLIDEADRQPTVSTVVTVYTSPTNGAGTRITQFNASLDSGTESFTVYYGAASGVITKLIPLVSLTGPDSSTPADMINVFIPAGDNLYVQVTTGTTIKFSASGIEL